jgi:hypothetical protein
MRAPLPPQPTTNASGANLNTSSLFRTITVISTSSAKQLIFSNCLQSVARYCQRSSAVVRKSLHAVELTELAGLLSYARIAASTIDASNSAPAGCARQSENINSVRRNRLTVQVITIGLRTGNCSRDELGFISRLVRHSPA